MDSVDRRPQQVGPLGLCHVLVSHGYVSQTCVRGNGPAAWGGSVPLPAPGDPGGPIPFSLGRPDYPRRVRRHPPRRGIVGFGDEEVGMLARRYEIHMRGAVPATLLAEMQAAHPTLHVRTVLSGTVRDQAELQGLLRRLHSLGLELLEMRQIPDAQATPAAPPPPRQRAGT